MAVPRIALNTNGRQYAMLVNLAYAVIEGLTDNPNFVSPAVSIGTLIAASTEAADAIAIWGTRSNRGSHENLMDLKLKAITLLQLLKAEAAYVETTAILAAPRDYAAMAAMMATSGFVLKASKRRQGVLNAVQKLRFMRSGSLNRNQVKVVWDIPLEVTSVCNVKSYNIYRSLTTDFADAVLVDTKSSTEFIDANITGAVVTYSYFVIAIGAAGQGAVSTPITITLLPA